MIVIAWRVLFQVEFKVGGSISGWLISWNVASDFYF